MTLTVLKITDQISFDLDLSDDFFMIRQVIHHHFWRNFFLGVAAHFEEISTLSPLSSTLKGLFHVFWVT